MNATPEEWRPVIGSEGSYEVSSHGRVRSIDHPVRCKGEKTRMVRGRILAQGSTSSGYCRVCIGSGNSRGVHHLVLEAFIGPRPPGLVCCHSDGNPLNNHLENLRWDTQSSNIADQVRHGTHTNASKTRCPQGHEYTSETIYIAPKRGERQCRICRRAQFLAFHGRRAMDA